MTGENAAPAEMPGVEERLRRILAEARIEPEPEASDFAVENIKALFAPILAEKEREIEQLCATIRKAHVAMTMACALPGVASEYDFSEAIASTEATLARRAAAIRAEGSGQS